MPYPHTRQAADLDQRWQAFIGFWLLAGLTLLAIGIATFAVVAHAHRIGALLVLAGLVSLVIGLAIRRAGRRGD